MCVRAEGVSMGVSQCMHVVLGVETDAVNTINLLLCS